MTTAVPPPGVPSWGARYRDFLAQSFTRHTSMVAQTENLAYADQTIDLDPNVRDAWGLPAPRITYDWRRPNEVARTEYMLAKMEEIGRTMGATQVWRAPRGPGAPGAHHEGGTRMGNDPKNSVVNRYGQSWDIPNLRDRQLHFPNHQRIKSHSDHTGPRVYKRRRDSQPLQKKSRTAAVGAATLEVHKSAVLTCGPRDYSA